MSDVQCQLLHRKYPARSSEKLLGGSLPCSVWGALLQSTRDCLFIVKRFNLASSAFCVVPRSFQTEQLDEMQEDLGNRCSESQRRKHLADSIEKLKIENSVSRNFSCPPSCRAGALRCCRGWDYLEEK